MPRISRPTKALGNMDYAKEVEQGKLDIIDVEIDKDFNTLYDGINKLDADNFTGPTKFTCAQVNLTDCIVNTDITAPGAPPTFGGRGIHGSKIQPGTLTVGSTELANNSVLIRHIAPTQTTQANAPGGDDDPQFGTIPVNSEFWLCGATWTTRGGYILIIASVSGSIKIDSQICDVILRLRLSESSQTDLSGNIIHEIILPYDTHTIAVGTIFGFSATLIGSASYILQSPLLNPKHAKVTILVNSGAPGNLQITSKRILAHESA